MKNSSLPDYFKRLFEYNYSTNKKLSEFLLTHQKQIPDKVIQLSCHISNAHFIWNSRILGKQTQLVPWNIFPIVELKEREEVNHESTKMILDQIDLDQSITYTNSLGDSYKKRVADILTHVVNHSTYHRGQIALLLRENGQNPIPSDFILFARSFD